MTATRSDPIDRLLAPLRADPALSAILSDLDGTLAPIVEDPSAAAIPDEARALLAALSERYALVGCITGRRALDARRIVGVEEVLYAGNHGLEILEPGAAEPTASSELAEREHSAAEFALELDSDELATAGLRLEDKGPIQAVHWRSAHDEDRAVEVATAIADAARAERLSPRWGRKVLEIRPLAGIDKGTAVRSLLGDRGVELAMFGGDDRTDLDAFEGLRALVRGGTLRAAVRVGVDSIEAPPGLEDHCDLLVDGTAGFLDVLRYLAADG